VLLQPIQMQQITDNENNLMHDNQTLPRIRAA